MSVPHPRHTVALIPGDGIGPEIAASIKEIFAAAHVPVDFEEHDAGLACYERTGSTLPATTLEAIKNHRVALKGPTTTPLGGGHKSVNVTIRKSLELYANVRPSKSLPSVKTRFDNVDLIIVRENIEDTYAGIEHWQSPEVCQCLRLITRPGCEAIHRYAFEMARSVGRKRVTCVHKSNIMKLTDGLFLDVFREVAAHYPDIQADDILIDNLCMQLVVRPEKFDVLVLPNLFGDIASDLCAGLVGGLGVAPGGNIGDGIAVFEAVHGSAPDIAGKDMANPTALLLSAVQMLYYMGLNYHAVHIESALRYALIEGVRTADLGGNARTREFTKAVVASLPKNVPEDAADFAPGSLYGGGEGKPKPAPAPARVNEPMTVRGVDIFVQSDKDLPKIPEAVGRLKLDFKSNRGQKVWPGPLPSARLVDLYRCRYTAPAGSPGVTDAEIAEIQTAVGKVHAWSHLEKLLEQGGKAMYSKAHGD
ncbi:MAG: isocitrate dehydrogenase [Planctomycetes bacterium]|nr:isocitrate dehydrogenase [Planctomycetota bacterium]